LKNQPGKDMSVVGIHTAQTLMRNGLIDEYWLVVQPVIWVNGMRLFDGLNERKNLILADTRTFKFGDVVLHYITE
jgi:dihydrofolate reductase